MTDSCCDPSPNTGASPVRANLKTLRTSRSHSPYTVGGRTMVHEPAIVRTSCSAASLLWPYGVTGDGGRVSSIGLPGSVGPAAAGEEESTEPSGGRCAGASGPVARPTAVAALEPARSAALMAPR